MRERPRSARRFSRLADGARKSNSCELAEGEVLRSNILRSLSPLPDNRAEGSHVPIRLRERKMPGFRSPRSAQRFLADHAAVADTFTTCRHPISAANHRLFRDEAFVAWREAAELAA